MAAHYDDFSTYINGDLAGQGNWSKGTGNIEAYSGGTYVSSIDGYDYKKPLDPGYDINSIIHFYANLVLTTYTYAGWRYPPFTRFGLSKNPTIDDLGCGIYIQPYGEKFDIWCGAITATSENMDYLGRYAYNIGSMTTIEFVHNFETRRFEYIRCLNPNFYFEDKQGSNVGGSPNYWHIVEIRGAWENYQHWYNIFTEVVGAAPTARHRFTGGIQHRALH